MPSVASLPSASRSFFRAENSCLMMHDQENMNLTRDVRITRENTKIQSLSFATVFLPHKTLVDVRLTLPCELYCIPPSTPPPSPANRYAFSGDRCSLIDAHRDYIRRLLLRQVFH